MRLAPSCFAIRRCWRRGAAHWRGSPTPGNPGHNGRAAEGREARGVASAGETAILYRGSRAWAATSATDGAGHEEPADGPWLSGIVGSRWVALLPSCRAPLLNGRH